MREQKVDVAEAISFPSYVTLTHSRETFLSTFIPFFELVLNLETHPEGNNKMQNAIRCAPAVLETREEG
jgi:hypothetical protein